MRTQNNHMTTNETLSNTWPALVDVIIATLMILLLFIIIQYLSFFLSDALKRMDIIERQSHLQEMISKMEKDNTSVNKGSIQCTTRGDHQILRFSSELLFDKGKAEIDSNDYDKFDFLNALGKLLKKAYYKEHLYDQIYIEGHTDNDQITGNLQKKFHSNWELSAFRSLFITRYLIQNGYLKPELSPKRFLGVAGYGEYNILASNETDGGKKINRRIEILLVYSER